jgi:hypothetical protein
MDEPSTNVNADVDGYIDTVISRNAATRRPVTRTYAPKVRTGCLTCKSVNPNVNPETVSEHQLILVQKKKSEVR